jgi:hypothetical protein
MARARFGTAINCIDGRVQVPVIEWMRRFMSVDYVDLVTQPGPDGLFARSTEDAEQLIRSRVELSVRGHGSPVVAVTGHFDCLANPVSDDEHRQQLLQAMKVLQGWNLGVQVLALWVTEQWQVEVVQTRSAADRG